jgi:RNA polymerase sigma-70 factor, ECF subfamily
VVAQPRRCLRPGPAPVTFAVVRRLKNNREGTTDEVVPTELLERCRRGDEQAWAELVEATYRDVYGLCLRILRHPDDAAEATQDAYLKAWRGLRGFRGDALFTTWLYRVATNAAITKQRNRKRRWDHEVETQDEGLSEMPSLTTTEAVATARLDLADVERALGRLPEHYRTAIVLRDVYGLSIEEMAQHLGISETAAKVRVHRGRKKLKEIFYLEDDGQEGDRGS